MNSTPSIIFQALADPTRQKILKLLTEGEFSVTELCEHFSITQPSISHHLGILKKSGLVKAKKQGRAIHYSLQKEVFLREALPYLREIHFLS